MFNNATILLLIATLGHAGNAIAAKLAINDVSPMVIVTLRWGLVVLILFFIKKNKIKSSFTLMKKHSLWILFMGGIGLSGFSALFYTAPNYTSVINIGIIQCTMPAFILIGTLIIFKIRVLKTQVIGLFFTMLGVVILISNGNLSLLLNLVPNFGDILMLISCIFYASYSVGLQKRPVTDYLTMMFYFAMAAFITSIPMLSIEIYMDKVIWPNINGWIIILYIAVIPSLLSQVLFMRSIDLIGSNKAGLFTNLVPIFVAILGVIILNETFYLFHIISMITAFFGIYIFILADKTSNN